MIVETERSHGAGLCRSSLKQRWEGPLVVVIVVVGLLVEMSVVDVGFGVVLRLVILIMETDVVRTFGGEADVEGEARM